MPKNKFKDESKDRSYFIITPQLVWALSRNPHDYTLWNVVKMIAGEDSQCILATPDLADLAMMSTGQVSDSRKYLLKCGLLIGDFKRDHGYPQPVWHLRIPDLWPKNIAWRQALGDEISKRIEWKQEQKKSLQVVKPSPGDGGILPGDGGILPGETKDILIEEPKEEPLGSLPFGIDGQQRAVDKANGSHGPDPVEEVAKHLRWLCAGPGTTVPKGKEGTKYFKAARSLLENVQDENWQPDDWRKLCRAIDEWSENPPPDDVWWRGKTKEPGFPIDHLAAYYLNPNNNGKDKPNGNTRTTHHPASTLSDEQRAAIAEIEARAGAT